MVRGGGRRAVIPCSRCRSKEDLEGPASEWSSVGFLWKTLPSWLRSGCALSRDRCRPPGGGGNDAAGGSGDGRYASGLDLDIGDIAALGSGDMLGIGPLLRGGEYGGGAGAILR